MTAPFHMTSMYEPEYLCEGSFGTYVKGLSEPTKGRTGRPQGRATHGRIAGVLRGLP